MLITEGTTQTIKNLGKGIYNIYKNRNLPMSIRNQAYSIFYEFHVLSTMVEEVNTSTVEGK